MKIGIENIVVEKGFNPRTQFDINKLKEIIKNLDGLELEKR